MKTSDAFQSDDGPKVQVVFESELPPERKRALHRRRDRIGLALAIPGGVQLTNGEPVRGLLWFVPVVAAYVVFFPAGLVLHLISWCFLDSRRNSMLDRWNNDPW